MATITITYSHPQASYTRTITMADADLVRIVTAAKKNFYRPQTIVGPGGQMAGDPGPLTNQQALTRLTEDIWGGMKRMTRSYEEQQAIDSAKAGVVTITEV